MKHGSSGNPVRFRLYIPDKLRLRLIHRAEAAIQTEKNRPIDGYAREWHSYYHQRDSSASILHQMEEKHQLLGHLSILR